MPTKMLVDARHPEETRVVIQRDNKIEDFDFESAAKRQLKGNIYLAKVTRVEPSLQAAFVDYGGNRHGFLAFSEIHPDYYQIPVEDREALLEEEAADLPEEDDEETATQQESSGDTEGDENSEPTTVSGDSAEDEEEIRINRRNLRRRYKIQEVIKRRQILLIQVVKEERGNKGAALTTYLSLAGRYCVLMPNSTHSGGISRKIANGKDRKRLRTIMSDLDVPKGMGCIIRTAGLERTKTEIKRDYDYLLRLWDGIRERTLESVAPVLIHEEGDLIKRSIRDLYSRDIDQILVEGEGGYKTAKNFMRLLMPSHAKKVQQYKDTVPLFHRHRVEASMETMYSPTVQLNSGGYIVLNPTEALVAIDVNSGKSTREHNIEETALSTNMEAATEIARQLRMRDLAGLIVIDFIDMEQRQNIRSVERRMRDALKTDRARVQVGRISSFGLLEMSRQRLRPGLFEASSHICPTCKGAGAVRSVDSCALYALRALEEEAIKAKASILRISLQTDVALYILNQKRESLRDLEERYGISIEVKADSNIIAPEFTMEHSGPPPVVKPPELPAVESVSEDDITSDHDDEADEDEKKPGKKRRKRRRGRGGKKEEDTQVTSDTTQDGDDESRSEPTEDSGESVEQSETADKEDKPKRRRRGRRGGRNRRPKDSNSEGTTPIAAASDVSSAPQHETTDAPGTAVSEAHNAEPTPLPAAEDKTEEQASDSAADKKEEAPAKPARRRGRRPKKPVEAKATEDKATEDKAEQDEKPESTDEGNDAKAKPAARKRSPRKPRTPKSVKKTEETAEKTAKTENGKAPTTPKTEQAPQEPQATKTEVKEDVVEQKAPAEKQGPKRKGWWQRAIGG